MFYDGPDFEIPFVCPARDKWEYYHTDQDNIENFNFEQADEVLNIMKQTIDIFEKNIIPKRKYKGPLYLSKNQLMGDLRNSAIVITSYSIHYTKLYDLIQWEEYWDLN